MSNRDGAPRRLEPGIYGLGNLLLDSAEIDTQKARFREAEKAVEPLFSVLAEARIVNPQYGTRCSTVMLQGKDGRIQYAERSFDADGGEGDTLLYEL